MIAVNPKGVGSHLPLREFPGVPANLASAVAAFGELGHMDVEAVSVVKEADAVP